MRDCPALNWIELTETGDLSNLLKEDGKATIPQLEQAHDKIKDELFEKFGFPEDLSDYLEELRQIELFRCEWILSDNDSIRKQKEMWMEIHENKANAIIGEGSKFDVEDSVIAVEKYLNRAINLEEISIYKFRSYLRSLSNGKKNN